MRLSRLPTAEFISCFRIGNGGDTLQAAKALLLVRRFDKLT